MYSKIDNIKIIINDPRLTINDEDFEELFYLLIKIYQIGLEK